MAYKTITLPVAIGVLWILCFAGTLPAAEIITEQDIVQKVVPKEDFVRTADNFIIMFDSSSSMKEFVNKGAKETKYDVAKKILAERQKVLPDLGYNAGLYLYTPFKEVYPMGPYDAAKFSQAIDNLPTAPDGPTPLSEGILDIAPILEKLSGKTAVFIFSDGTFNHLTDVKLPEVHTRELAEKNNVCFYMISSATKWQAEKRLADMAKANACSRVIPIEAFINNSEYMTGALYTVKASAVVETTTESRITGLKVHNGNFDFNKANIRPEFQSELDEVGKFLQNNRDAYVMLVGYTDSIGSEEYNLGLSLRRADSAANYLTSNHNIGRDRIVVNYYGESNPIASNATAEGRAQNRRVEVAVGGLR
ncbi:MAG: OmpA family protein [Deltaproteobacteria bacterium]|jgi:OOP family OmpA-OmpF porin